MLVNKSSNNRKRKQAENLLRQFVDYTGDFLLFRFRAEICGGKSFGIHLLIFKVFENASGRGFKDA
jgi:hypothetical protein